MDELRILEYDKIILEIEQYCAFSLGKNLIKKLIPSYNILEIKQRLNIMYDTLNCVNRYGTLDFIGIKDISNYVIMAKKDGICTGIELLMIADQVRGIKHIVEYINNVDVEISYLKDLVFSLEIDENLFKAINSKVNTNGELMDSASPTLKSLRNQLRSIDSEINVTANKFIQQNSNKLMDNIISTRNNRVCILSKASEKNSFNGIIHGESSSGRATYVEPECLIIMNNKKQSLIYAHQEEENRILFELSQLVKKYADQLLANLETLAILDSYFARANWGKKHNATIATISDEEIILKNARHPLIDKEICVANTYRITNKQKMLLISGPNTGGKTVSMKIIGLFTLLSYAGIPVLCDEACIPLFDKIFVDIGDEQSIIQSLSTFSAHLSKLVYITNNVTKNSLVLLDEIGNGTDPKEGEALAIATLDYLKNIRCMCVVTTHYSGCIKYAKNYDEIMISSVQFDIEKMRPTFRYLENMAGSSNALAIAEKFTLNQKIIEMAHKIKESSKSNDEILLEKLENQLQQTLIERDKLKQEILKYDRLNNELLIEINKLDNEKASIIEKANQEANNYLEEVKSSAKLMLDDLKSKKETIKLHEVNKFMQSISNMEFQNEQSVFGCDEIQINDYVQMKNSQQIGKVLGINKNNALVELNGMKVNTKLDNLKLAPKPSIKKVNKQRSSVSVNKKANFNLECNLIGMRVNEAILILDKYLDDAILNNAPFVRIIHGSGTGALRKAVHDNLRKRKNIEYRLGQLGEGGVGATVVTFVGKNNG